MFADIDFEKISLKYLGKLSTLKNIPPLCFVLHIYVHTQLNRSTPKLLQIVNNLCLSISAELEI
jgi:hypothetical protein